MLNSLTRLILPAKIRKNKAGFTLIELLVVIAIIGLLASVVLVSVNSARQKSRDAKRLADINQIAKALELFYNDAAAYPTCSTSCSQSTPSQIMGIGSAGGTGTLSAITSVTGPSGKTLTPTYVTGVPQAPTPADGTLCTSANNAYKYAAPDIGNTYTITFCLGNAVSGFAAGSHFLTPSGVR